MAFTAFRDMKPFSQFLFSAFVILACFLAFMVLSLIIALPVFGLESVMNIPSISDFENPENIAILKYFQTVQAIGLFIVPPIILGYFFHGKVKEYLYLNKSANSSSFFLILLLMFFAGPFINFIGELNNNMSFPEWMSGIEQWMKESEENAAIITKAFLDVKTIPGLAFNVFMIAFLPAIGEELLFRGVIQRIFTNMTKSYHWGIWISAILFSALHMQFYGFVPRVLLGAIFGYMLIWSGSMWLPIVGHFLNNAFAVVGMYLINNGLISPDFEEIGSTSDSYYMAAFSLVLIIAFMLIIKRQNNGNQIVLDEPALSKLE
uniref:CPBP family intramembrane glutamic endopeptidase n=1 Tax=uncultured Draconibacterium sp. TaxID=1573823 RepID=UPI0032173525